MATDADGFVLEGVTRTRADVRILDGVDVAIPGDGITALVGRSGAGKSSLLRLLNRLDAPDAGRVSWQGVDLAEVDTTHHRRRVAHVAQAPITFEGTVADNLRVADAELDHAVIVELLGRVGIAGLIDQTASTLSGGEAQRMCIARALVSRPDVILADEPTSALDAEARDGIEALATEIAGDGVAWVWVSHDRAQTRRLADTVVVMEAGRILATGTLDEIDDHPDPAVRQALEA